MLFLASPGQMMGETLKIAKITRRPIHTEDEGEDRSYAFLVDEHADHAEERDTRTILATCAASARIKLF